MNKYTFATYILFFLLGADAIYIVYMPSIIVWFVLTTVVFISMMLAMKAALSQKCFAAANKKIVEKYGPIIMKYVEDTKKECMECGAILDKNARYCNKCGKKIK